MKKVLFIVFAFIGAYSYAQTPITLGLSDIGAPIRSYDQRVDSLVNPAIVPGAPAANVAWNFNLLNANLDSNSIDLINNASAPFVSSFPGTNFVAWYNHSLNYYYFDRSAAGLVMHGVVSDYLKTGDSVKVILSVPDTTLKLPGAYGNLYTTYNYGNTKSRCNYSIDTTVMGFPMTIVVDTIRVKHMQVKNVKMDAWGNVTTPTCTFPALRQKETAITLDSVWGYANVPAPLQSYSGWNFFTVISDTTDTYNWWMKGLGIPAIKMTMVKQTPIVNRVDWVYNVYLGVNETEAANSGVGIYPNPANDMLKITTTDAYNEMVIYDALGSEVARQNMQNKKEISLNVSTYSNGLYFYNLIGKTNQTNGKFVVKH